MTALETGTSGLGGVWAEENTRESIYDAMQRREVFGDQWRATPGFACSAAGDTTKDMLSKSDWAGQAYAGGVPMGVT